MNLHKLGAIQSHSDSLANDFCRVNKILKNGLVDGGQGATKKTLKIQLKPIQQLW